MNDDAFERFGHPDLTAQTAVRTPVGNGVEHERLGGRHRGESVQPAFVDKPMAGRTAAGTAALAEDAGYAVVDRQLHQRPLEVALDGMDRAAVFDESDDGHGV